MLHIDLRTLDASPVDTDVALPANAPVFDDLDLALAAPVQVRGRLTQSGEGRYFWHGVLETEIEGSCRRCLVPVIAGVRAEVGALFTEDDAADDPSTYPLPPRAGELDLGTMVREELLLAAPAYLLCREDCRGLCARCGKDLNDGPCSCEPEPDPRWDALRALKGQVPDDER